MIVKNAVNKIFGRCALPPPLAKKKLFEAVGADDAAAVHKILSLYPNATQWVKKPKNSFIDSTPYTAAEDAYGSGRAKALQALLEHDPRLANRAFGAKNLPLLFLPVTPTYAIKDLMPVMKAAGADLDIRDEDGKTSLMTAFYETAAELVKHSADVNAKDNEGRTAAYYLNHSEYWTKEKLRILADANIDLRIKDNHGQTAVEFLLKKALIGLRAGPIRDEFGDLLYPNNTSGACRAIESLIEKNPFSCLNNPDLRELLQYATTRSDDDGTMKAVNNIQKLVETARQKGPGVSIVIPAGTPVISRLVPKNKKKP